MSDTIHPLLDNNMLDFQSISDEKLFLENIGKGNFVMLIVRALHLQKCYKYKMPIFLSSLDTQTQALTESLREVIEAVNKLNNK